MTRNDPPKEQVRDEGASSREEPRRKSGNEIRERALEALRLGRFDIDEELLAGADVKVTALVESLRIYQAELEIQYQELQAAQRTNQFALERFASFFNGLPIAELVVDVRGLVVEANVAAQKLFELKHTHFHQHYFMRLIADRDRPKFVQGWRMLSEQDDLEFSEIHFEIPNRKDFIGDLHIATLPPLADGTRHYVCAVIDRTEKVMQGRSLSEAQYNLDKRMRELSCLYDVVRITERDDVGLHEMLESVVARLPASMQYPDRCLAAIDCGEMHYGSEIMGARITAEFISWEGRTGTVTLAYDPALPGDAQELFLVEERDMLDSIAHRLSTIVTRREALSDLRDNHNLVETIFRRAPDAIELIDRETLRFVDVNDACCQILGYDRKELLDLRVVDLLEDLSAEQTFALAEEILSAGDAKFETRHRRKDGAIIDSRVHVRALNLRGRDYLLSIWRDITAEKAAEAEIRKLSTVVEQSPNPVVITDLEARIEYVNDAFVQKTGYAASEVIGQTPRILQSGKTPRTTYEEMWRTLGSGLPWKGEFVNRTQSGREQVESATIIPLRRHDGEITHYVAIKEDITERKRLYDELERHRYHLEREVEARTAELEATTASLIEASKEQQALFDFATAGIVFVRDRRIVRLNRTLAELFGYPFDEMIGLSTRAWYGDEGTFLAIGQEIRESFAQGRFHSEVRELIRKDGSRFWGRMTAQPIDWNDPEKGLAGMIIDITAERAAQQAMETANAQMRAILDSASSGIVLLKDWFVVRCNRRMHDILGWPDGTLIDRSARSWYPDDSSFALAVEEAGATIASTHRYQREQIMRRKDGNKIWTRMTGTAIDPSQPDAGTVWIVDDITAEREAVAKMAEAKSIAEAAARTKSDFLANMSHEIRTPMNAIIGLSFLALNTELTPKQLDYVSHIHKSAQMLLGILNDILDVSKIEAGRLELETIPFGIDEVLDQVVSVVSHKADEKRIELLIDCPSDLPVYLIGDPLRLGQILINLLNNALKFTDEGEVLLKIRPTEHRGNRLRLEMEVQDTGIGMTQDQQGKLFQAFGQADGSTTRKYGGTGLGLTICKELVEMMHGAIGVESEFGGGSTFRFDACFSIDRARSQPRLVDDRVRGIKVLAVEDHRHAREILCRILVELGYVATAVSGADAAFDALLDAEGRDDPYRLVLMDWRMPDMDGIEATRRIKQELPLSRRPMVLLLTSSRSEDVYDPAELVGAETVLHKPVSHFTLSRTLCDVLGVAAGQDIAHHDENDMEGADRSLAGARVLLVEDNEINQQIAIELLERVGIQVMVARNGREAVDLLLGSDPPTFDGVLMDVQMPVMGGHEATRLICAEPRYRDLPIVGLTAHAMMEERERCLAAGMRDHVTKPIDPRALYRIMACHFKTRSGVRPTLSESAVSRDEASVLPQIPGIDIVDAMSRVQGSLDFYRRLLRRFVEDQSDSAERISNALAAGDREVAERGAHSLKGLAGNIGATQLFKAAGALETAIRTQVEASELSVILKGFETELHELTLNLETFLATMASEAPVRVVAEAVPAPRSSSDCRFRHAERASPLLDGLIGALSNSEIDEAAIAGLREALNAETFETLNELVESFELEGAAELVRSLQAEALRCIGKT